MTTRKKVYRPSKEEIHSIYEFTEDLGKILEQKHKSRDSIIAYLAKNVGDSKVRSSLIDLELEIDQLAKAVKKAK